MNWMQGHTCPCTMATDSPGSPNPTCLTCHGRGHFWDAPQGPFTLLRTFMHTSEAADEPGNTMDPRVGQQMHAEPTITIPSDIQPLYSLASEFDAFQEIDGKARYETAMVVGQDQIIPYQLGLQVLSVTAYDLQTQRIVPLNANQFTVNNGLVDLIGFPTGTAFTVAYFANPVWVIWRRSGGMPHNRLFGAGTDALPTRFRAMMLDLWLRARNQKGFSASPNAI